jgi:hypothetical protein
MYCKPPIMSVCGALAYFLVRTEPVVFPGTRPARVSATLP